MLLDIFMHCNEDITYSALFFGMYAFDSNAVSICIFEILVVFARYVCICIISTCKLCVRITRINQYDLRKHLCQLFYRTSSNS